MRGPVQLVAATAVAAMLYGTPASGAELRLVGAATSFYCFQAPGNAGHVAGLACDLVSEMARRVGHPGGISLYPLARALTVAAQSRGVLVAPVARVAARENLFGWQVQIFEDDVVVVTRAGSGVDISSLEALRTLSIGVVRSGVGALLCEQFDLRNVSPVANDDTNARKLATGRIDAWISTWNGILAAQRDVGESELALRRGMVVSRVQAYMASSPDVAPEQMEDWRRAMAAMVRDGTYASILRKYRFQLPK